MQLKNNELKLSKRLRIFIIYILKQPYRETKYFFISLAKFITNIFSKTKDKKSMTAFLRRPRALLYIVVLAIIINLIKNGINEESVYNLTNKILFIILIINILWKEWIGGKHIEEYRRLNL